jgi:hypothetical protein
VQHPERREAVKSWRTLIGQQVARRSKRENLEGKCATLQERIPNQENQFHP